MKYISLQGLQTFKTKMESLINSKIDSKLASKQAKINHVHDTLKASGWDSSNMYSFESTYPKANYDLELVPDGQACGDDKLEAWNKAQIYPWGLLNKIVARGDKPTVDIPIILKVMPK